jgi:predicted nucleic acid-binding protein
MSPSRTIARGFPKEARPRGFRYTIDASVFLNASNAHEPGHPESVRLLRAIEQASAPLVVPTLVVAEIASAIARTTDDRDAALLYASTIASLPHMMLAPLSASMARHTADIAATYRLRGSDATYVAVADRYATTLVSRDREQIARGSRVVACQTPEQALAHFGG